MLRRAAVGCDAAYHDARVVRALFLHVETGDVEREFVQIRDAEFTHAFTRGGADRNGHVADIFLTFLCRNDDDLQIVDGFGGERRLRRGAQRRSG